MTLFFKFPLENITSFYFCINTYLLNVQASKRFDSPRLCIINNSIGMTSIFSIVNAETKAHILIKSFRDQKLVNAGLIIDKLYVKWGYSLLLICQFGVSIVSIEFKIMLYLWMQSYLLSYGFEWHLFIIYLSFLK